MPSQCLDISPEVSKALARGQPVVALESTILSHGMPWPENVETAHAVEKIIRDTGAVPATTAILKGRLKAGLSEAEIDYIGSHSQEMHKASRRDLPWLMAKGENGTTTVASTMIIAAKAGIRIFATGGIGGVHRGAQETFDISADLQELARTPVAVVCAGPKIILDLGLTMEYLETMGVTVVGYGTHKLPGFYVRETQWAVDCRADSPVEVANILRARWSLGVDGGVLITNPVEKSQSLTLEEVEVIMEGALQDMASEGVTGKAITPWLIKRLHEATRGRSLATNIELLKNNVQLAAQIACDYC
ncbi:pseudouridine-5'-phosphate glycosidase [Endozoicomonas atrinae]|uniref:pseudouridine-5'-phosphate glycosidase n=1 Tax=Endozoicomonas atrinae TaxID=1333660 RepID=UPI00082593D6|nr:pseudouridine-5'-phosphate glycosidase [Endozoicomonas atrinae]